MSISSLELLWNSNSGNQEKNEWLREVPADDHCFHMRAEPPGVTVCGHGVTEPTGDRNDLGRHPKKNRF